MVLNILDNEVFIHVHLVVLVLHSDTQTQQRVYLEVLYKSHHLRVQRAGLAALLEVLPRQSLGFESQVVSEAGVKEANRIR